MRHRIEPTGGLAQLRQGAADLTFEALHRAVPPPPACQQISFGSLRGLGRLGGAGEHQAQRFGRLAKLAEFILASRRRVGRAQITQRQRPEPVSDVHQWFRQTASHQGEPERQDGQDGE